MKRAISLLLTLVMLLGLFPMATFAEGTETTLPQVTLSVDKTTVEAGDDVTLTLTLDKDIETIMGNWQWNFVWNSDYFTAKSSQIGTAATPFAEVLPITPKVNLSATSYFAAPYKAASVTAGDALTPHYLKAGTIASVTLTAVKDIPEGESVKFFVTQPAQLDSSGNEVVVTRLDPAQNWGSNTQTLPDDSVGLTVTAPVAPIDITVYYADNGKIVTSDKDGETLLNFAPVHVTDINDDGKLTMYDGFACLHEQYHSNGVAGYTDNNWVTQFWSVSTSMVSYGHNNSWVFSTAEEIADGDSLCLFTYQDTSTYSDLFTYFDSLTATATAKEETSFSVNGISFMYSSSSANATAAPVGATVTASCEGQNDLTTTVGEDGSFKLTFPVAGTWTVLVSGKCTYTPVGGYASGSAIEDAPVAPAMMTVTVEDAAYVAPDPVNVTMYYATAADGIVTGKDGTLLNYVSVAVSDANKDGKLTIDDAFLTLHEKYYDGTDGYSRTDSTYTFWGQAMTNFWISQNDATATGASEIKAGDRICAINHTYNLAAHVYFNDGVTGTATAGEETTFDVTVYNRSGVKGTLNSATVTATCGDVTATGKVTNNVLTITFPSAGTYTMEIKGQAPVENRVVPLIPALMTVTVAEAQVDPDPTPDPDPEPTVTGYTVTMPEDKELVVDETVEIAPVVTHADENVTTYNAFDMTFTYDAEALELTSTTIEGLTVTTGTGTVRVQGYGEARNVGTAPFTLTFKAKTTGNVNVTVTTAKVDAADHAITNDAPDATLADATTGVTVTGYPVNLPDDFTGNSVAQPNEDYTFTAKDKNYNYTFENTTMGGEKAEVVDNGDGTFTIKDVNGAIDVKFEKTGKTFNVTLGTDMTGESTAQYMTVYEATLTQDSHYSYDVSVTIGGVAYTGFGVENGKYTIPGKDITGDIVFTVTRTPIQGSSFNVKFEGSGAGDATGESTVAPDASYSFVLTEEQGYDYEVKATMGGQDASFTEADGTYTFEKVTGDLVITITKTLHLEVEVRTYVELDGKTVALVTANATLGTGKALSYDGTVMFWSDNYNAWCYLVIVEGTTLPTAEEATAKIVATESSYTTLSGTKDVNESGKVDINDAQLVYDIYNGKYEDFTTVTMQKFLNADVNADREVNVNDAAAVVAAIG